MDILKQPIMVSEITRKAEITGEEVVVGYAIVDGNNHLLSKEDVVNAVNSLHTSPPERRAGNEGAESGIFYGTQGSL